MTKLWGGRFAGKTDPRFAEFNRSLHVDFRFVLEDIGGSEAWANALARAGVLTKKEAMTIVTALHDIAAEIDQDPTAFAESDAEDVHAYVESCLAAKVGDLARKLHTGRSRNDQVATDLKLWMRTTVIEISLELEQLITALVELAEPNTALPMPGYTHLQRAQPITVGHHLLAYAAMFDRDRNRIYDCSARMDTCPLGSGALAGTAYDVDRDALSKELGFAHPTRNSIDAVSDRDHVCELLFVCSMIGVHLSRLAEDWIFFSSTEAGFLELSDAIATGSSLMPQKKNPDSLELLRGKSARTIGHLVGLITLMKGLPLAYDKDMQEDKEALFDAVDTTMDSLAVATIVVRNVRFRADRCREEASKGYLNATDLADLLVAKGTSFRDAHEKTGAAVRAAIEAGCELEDLPSARVKQLLPELSALSPAELKSALSVEACLARRKSIGGTAPTQVAAEIKSWKKELESWNNPR